MQRRRRSTRGTDVAPHVPHGVHRRHGGPGRLRDIFHLPESPRPARRRPGRDRLMQQFLAMFPAQASTHAAEVDQMTIYVHWLMLVLFVGWGAFFLFVLFRFRAGANPKADYAGAKGKFAKSTEVAVAIVEVILLVVYAIPAWATRVRAFPAESEAVVVHVTGEQFSWN